MKFLLQDSARGQFQSAYSAGALCHFPASENPLKQLDFSLQDFVELAQSLLYADLSLELLPGSSATPQTYRSFWKRHDAQCDTGAELTLSELFPDELTLRQTKLEERSSALANLERAIADHVGCGTRIDASYAHSIEALPLGWRYRPFDTMVIQLTGTSCWRVNHEVYPLPIVNSKEGEYPKDPSLFQEYRMQAGSFLFIPRGHWFDVSWAEAPGLYLTLNVFPWTSLNILDWAMARAAEQSALRETFPVQFADDRDLDPMREKMGDFVEQTVEMLTQPDFEELFSGFMTEHLTNSCEFRTRPK